MTCQVIVWLMYIELAVLVVSIEVKLHHLSMWLNRIQLWLLILFRYNLSRCKDASLFVYSYIFVKISFISYFFQRLVNYYSSNQAPKKAWKYFCNNWNICWFRWFEKCSKYPRTFFLISLMIMFEELIMWGVRVCFRVFFNKW